jgi:hypothetical protein
MHQHVIWTPTPSLERQALSISAMTWAEAPWYSSHLCVVPSLMQSDFGRVNKNILLVGHFGQLPLPAEFKPLVPFLIFYLPPFIRSLPNTNSHGMDTPTSVFYTKWVRAKADSLRGPWTRGAASREDTHLRLPQNGFQFTGTTAHVGHVTMLGVSEGALLSHLIYLKT